jgi:hypothetical protein
VARFGLRLGWSYEEIVGARVVSQTSQFDTRVHSVQTDTSPYGRLSQNGIAKTMCHVLHHDWFLIPKARHANHWVRGLRSVLPFYVAIPILAAGLAPDHPREARSGERLISPCLLPSFQIHARLVGDLFRLKPALA